MEETTSKQQMKHDSDDCVGHSCGFPSSGRHIQAISREWGRTSIYCHVIAFTL